jgi:hypothetical protein
VLHAKLNTGIVEDINEKSGSGGSDSYMILPGRESLHRPRSDIKRAVRVATDLTQLTVRRLFIGGPLSVVDSTVRTTGQQFVFAMNDIAKLSG